MIIATGLAPENNLYEVVKEKIDEVYCIADCIKSGKIINAVWRAYKKARLV